MKKNTLKNMDNLRELWGNMKHNNICIIGIAEGEEEQGIEKAMAENSLTWGREKSCKSRSTEGPNQDEPKEAHFKTHHN